VKHSRRNASDCSEGGQRSGEAKALQSHQGGPWDRLHAGTGWPSTASGSEADHFRLSNVQCNQHNNTDPNYERRERYGIIFQPVPALYTHGCPHRSRNSRGRHCDGPLGSVPWFSVTGAAINYKMAAGCFRSISIVFRRRSLAFHPTGTPGLSRPVPRRRRLCTAYQRSSRFHSSHGYPWYMHLAPCCSVEVCCPALERRCLRAAFAACVNAWAAITKASATMTKNLFIAGLQLQNRGRALPSYMKVIGFGPRM
jgi:hypothetical protein